MLGGTRIHYTRRARECTTGEIVRKAREITPAHQCPRDKLLCSDVCD